MTKKKGLIYFIIFILMVSVTYVWQKYYLASPTEKFPDVCKMVIAPSCQYYVTNLSEKGKYAEAVKIQKVRISENEKILNFFKHKINNKCLLGMSPKEADDTLKACHGIPAKEEKAKMDYFILSTADFTIQDIVTDSISVSRIERKEFKQPEEALKTLKKAKRIVEKNEFFSLRKEALKLLDAEIKQTR